MNTQDPSPFTPGSRVVIHFNPHEEEASGIVGTVIKFEPRSGFMGCDMATVRYTRPSDGATRELPFGTQNLRVGNRGWLLEQAARHDEQAAQLRGMAEEVSS